MLNIKNLHASVGENEILKGLSLSVKPGEVHAIMGPNGSGKSTFGRVLAGHPDYQVTQGSVEYDVNFKPHDLLDMEPEERAREGLFLSFQYPVEVPGVSNFEFLRASFNAICQHQGVEPMDAFDFKDFVQKRAEWVNLGGDFLNRGLNEDFSGGEKKRNEILQMAVLSPRLSILDETDSGLDVDSLKYVAAGINKLRAPHNSTILITHYQRLLDFVKPDFVHIMVGGKLVKSGAADLALLVEKQGYQSWTPEAGSLS